MQCEIKAKKNIFRSDRTNIAFNDHRFWMEIKFQQAGIDNNPNNKVVKSKMNRMHSYDEIKLSSQDMKKSTSLELIGGPVSHMEYLVGILKCPICSLQVKQAHMCPMCCKLFCELCIKNSIVYKKAQCPCCAKPLRYTSPINCEALVKQIEQAINKTMLQISAESREPQSPYNSKVLSVAFSTPDLNSQQSRICLSSASSVNLCPDHELKLQYYCETCAVGVCSDCAVLSSKHQGHKLCKFSQKRVKFMENINLLLKSIANMKSDLGRKSLERAQKIDNIRRSERQKKQLVTNYLKKYSESTQTKISTISQVKSQMLNSQRILFESLSERLRKYESIMLTQQKVSLVKKSAQYIKEISWTMKNQLKNFTNHKQALQNDFSPPFGSKTFILDNYSYLKEKGDILYSEPLFCKGVQWKLRIFPGGIEDSKSLTDNERFLAIYLEMSKGHRQSNIYKYEIILINQLDRSKAIGCTFENQFEEGTYWGLDRFANIAFLQAENFIHPVHGYLEIVLNVKSPTYYHAIKDQNYFIKQKETVKSSNLNNLKMLRKKAGKRILDLAKIDRKSLLVQALTDEPHKGKVKQRSGRSCPCF